MIERLTSKRCNGIKSGYWSSAKKDELVQRLGEYESTGWSPADIKTIMEMYDDIVHRYSWRDARKDPPNEDGEYLVVIHGAREATTLLYDNLNESWYESDMDAMPYRVDWWMPLPTIPEGVVDDD